MSTILLIKRLTYIRMLLWYVGVLICSLTHTLFIIQTCSKSFVFILILNFFICLISLFIYNYRGYYQKTKRILVIFLPVFTVATFIIYIIYMFNINYRTMNLFTINMMNNDRHQSLLSNTLRYHKCCRIQEEILFDSQNEREYFRLFPHCQKSIEENEKLKDHWDNITTCGTLFKSIVFYTRFILIIDLILNFSIMTVSLIHIWEETDEWVNDNQCTLTITDNINYKAK